MAAFVSAGHHLSDPGAPGVGGAPSESRQAIRVRDKVVTHLTSRLGIRTIIDNDSETLSQYLARIQPGSSSVVVEFHFNAFNGKATGTEVLVGNDADRMDRAFAAEMAAAGATVMGIANRGVKTEAESRRGRLGLMREQGIVALVEVCFIDNPNDMQAFERQFEALCSAYANVIAKYDRLIP